jgi:hypothetical protein
MEIIKQMPADDVLLHNVSIILWGIFGFLIDLAILFLLLKVFIIVMAKLICRFTGTYKTYNTTKPIPTKPAENLSKIDDDLKIIKDE